MDDAYLRLRLFYADIYNIPRHYTRFVCWNLSVLPVASAGARRRSIKAIRTPFSNYYTQTDADEGYDMLTTVPINENNGPECFYLEKGKRKLTLQIEWLDSHLLLHDAYHRLDDITRLHKHQMKRELLALQAENYALEKQLHSYQQSIAKTSTKGHFTMTT
ncbi:uncharacterized protein LOC135495924 [Lineus longissimus]|uniref:uncharacterized protein LOC135495924 n=1 Tax=Lineus longissimus TaxID=88925 RepID=UPI00315CCA49